LQQYVDGLGKLFEQAAADPAKVIEYARAAVTNRDQLRDSLISVARVLNSELDRLKQELQAQASEAAIRQTMETLRIAWPLKAVQAKVEIRKALVELGALTVRRE
jgi:folylpolyglutamate synthase/dihydropteroate synthase